MTSDKGPPRLTRRSVLTGLIGGGIVVGAGGLALGLNQALKAGSVAEADLLSVYIGQPVPATDPDSDLWEEAEAVEVALTGQTMIAPMKEDPAPKSVKVRSLHDGRKIAFLMEWDDPQEDNLTIKTDQFRDACAVLLGAYPAPLALWLMGTKESPVTILHWKADWQLDIDKGFQDLEVAFPNASFDFYPPLVEAERPLKLPEAYPETARAWLPGWHVGNPLSQPVKGLPVEKLQAIGPGTITAFPTQDGEGRGRWRDRKWKAALAKGLTGSDDQELGLSPGEVYSIAFAVWSGAEQGVGARKSVTRLSKLRIQAR